MLSSWGFGRKTMRNILKNILTGLVEDWFIVLFILTLIPFSVILLKVVIERQELYECVQWQSQSEQYVNWYSTSWQKEQCQHYGIQIK